MKNTRILVYQFMISYHANSSFCKTICRTLLNRRPVLFELLIIVQCLFQFQSLVDHISGEESNKFTNTLGESVVVTIQDSEDATAELLCLLSSYSLIA